MDRLAIIQMGSFRFIGTLSKDNGLDYVLSNVGAILVQRGAMPGTIQGTVNIVKETSVVTIDLAKKPVPKMILPKAPDNIVYVNELDEEDCKVTMDVYERFLNGEQAGVRLVATMRT